MPECPDPKARLHPFRIRRHEGTEAQRHEGSDPVAASTSCLRASVPPCLSSPHYAELHVTSNFTFLTGASHPEELVEQAAALGYRAIAITDRNSLAGIVRAHIAAKETGMQMVVGCRVEVGDERHEGTKAQRHEGIDPSSASTSCLCASVPPSLFSILVYPTNRVAYSRLCRLLTVGKRRAPKGECHLTLHDLIEHQEGLLAVIMPPPILDQHFLEVVRGLRTVFDNDRLSLAASCLYGDDDAARLAQLVALSKHLNVPLVATNDVHYHISERRALQDVLTCIRESCTIHNAGFRLFPNGERYLKSPDDMADLFMEYPRAIERTIEIAQRAAGFSLDELKYEYPDEVCPPGRTPMEHLMDLTWKGAAERFPRPEPRHSHASALEDNPSIPEKVRNQIIHEFDLINELNYAPYFLTVHDLVTYARSKGILCQGRGAAANSAVCYCLGVTAVDPARIDLLFERFISRERNEPPDIDIDFEHERREEVIQYIYNKYGRDRAALTAEVITYRGRSAVRDVGKALGLSLDCVDRLAKDIDWWLYDPNDVKRISALGLNPHDPTIRLLCKLSHDILGFPRHLSQHVGGFVITRSKLHDLVPIENAAMDDRTVIEWDKDDIDAMGMLKVDVLGLGMLTAISKAFALLNADAACGLAHALAQSRKRLELHTVPPEDPAVYDMICTADTIGVFQIESRAQMTMLPRLKPRCYYDLVIEVAIVRPGPIQGNMVHPYLRRRNGEEPITYPDEAVRRVLGKTLGVPLFQEQAMNLAIVAAGFTPGEADALRRAMAAWKRKGDQIYRFGQRLINGMLERGYPREFAERCFEQIKGFSEYGFPESHAASFALLVYVSAWLKKHHPAAFAAAIINSQPMGFYAPAQLVRDAQEHGVEVRPVDVNCSAWDCTLECPFSRDPQRSEGERSILRLGLRLVKGLRQDEAQRIVDAVRQHRRFRDMHSLWRASGVRVAAMKCLASADAFGSMGLDRQTALWHVRALRDECLPIFEQAVENGCDAASNNGTLTNTSQNELRLPPVSPPRKVIYDYAALGLSLKAHPVSFIRKSLNARNVTRAIELKEHSQWPTGKSITVAGMVLVRQRPATASGIVFMTIEDETGVANLIVRPKIYQRFRRAARHAVLLLACGHIERQGDVVHVLTHRMDDIGHELADLTASSRDFH